MLKSFFRMSKEDLFASFSLLLISLPISAGIAVASKAQPEAGIIAAIVGSLFMGLFTSAPLIVYGPAAGLSIFISSAVVNLGGFNMVAPAIILAGIWLILLSYLRAYRIVNFFPTLVMKGMAAGIGLILILKMFPHLLGYDDLSFLNDQFILGGGRNTLSEIAYSFQHFLPGAVLITVLSLIFVFVTNWLAKKNKIARMSSNAIWLVVLGIVANEGMKVFIPEWALSGNHVLTVNTNGLSFNSFPNYFSNWRGMLETSFIITAVIMIEGLVTLDIFQRLDPKHSQIKFRKELFLMGIGNILMGFLSGLPIMPVLIRSKANLEFGAKNRSTILLHGLLLVAAFFAGGILGKIPMASVAVILLFIGIHLVDVRMIQKLLKKGVKYSLPFFVTLAAIIFFNLLWGILAGLVVGVVISIQGMVHRSMVVVHDDKNYLLKFYKDVSFFNKGELRNHLQSIPDGKEVVIDGTGNISVDSEIELFLEEFVEELKGRGCKVTFAKSRLAVSKLFKEV